MATTDSDTRGSRFVFLAFSDPSPVATRMRSPSTPTHTGADCGEPSGSSDARCAKFGSSSSERRSGESAIGMARLLSRAVGGEAHGLGARLVVGDDVDDRRLAGGVGALERRPDLVRLLDELAVGAQLLRDLVVARVAETASGLGQRTRPRRIGRQAAVGAE